MHSVSTLAKMQKSGMVVDMPPIVDNTEICEVWMKGKQPFPQESKVSLHLLQLIHVDLCRKMQTMVLGGSFCLIDDYTRKTWVYFLKEKSQEWVALVELEMGMKVKKANNWSRRRVH